MWAAYDGMVEWSPELLQAFRAQPGEDREPSRSTSANSLRSTSARDRARSLRRRPWTEEMVAEHKMALAQARLEQQESKKEVSGNSN